MNNIMSFKTEFGLILIGAVIFTASFMWKDLLSDFEDVYFPKNCGLMSRFIYTIVITILLVLLSIFLKNFFGLYNHKIHNKFDDHPINDDNDNVNVDVNVDDNIDVSQ